MHGMRLLLCAALLGPSAALVVSSQHRSSVSPQLRSSVSRGCSRSSAAVMQAEELTPGVGEGRNLPSPSGINTYPLPLQAATVVGITAGIALLAACIAGPGFDAVRGSGLWNLSRPTWPLLPSSSLPPPGLENVRPTCLKPKPKQRKFKAKLESMRRKAQGRWVAPPSHTCQHTNLAQHF